MIMENPNYFQPEQHNASLREKTGNDLQVILSPDYKELVLVCNSSRYCLYVCSVYT